MVINIILTKLSYPCVLEAYTVLTLLARSTIFLKFYLRNAKSENCQHNR